MSSVLDRATEEEYVALVRAFPLLSIRNSEHLENALNVLDGLLAKPERTSGEEAYLSALTDLVETYENAHAPIPPVSGVAALRYLLQENGLESADLGSAFTDPKDIQEISETLSGARQLTLEQVKSLAAYFGVPGDVFIA